MYNKLREWFRRDCTEQTEVIYDSRYFKNFSFYQGHLRHKREKEHSNHKHPTTHESMKYQQDANPPQRNEQSNAMGGTWSHGRNDTDNSTDMHFISLRKASELQGLGCEDGHTSMDLRSYGAAH
jgi:hypothetical protein